MGNFLRRFGKCEKQSASSSGEKKPSPIDFAARKSSQGILARKQRIQESSSEPKGAGFHGKGLRRDAPEMIGNEEVIFSYHRAESKWAQDWLRGNNDGPEPRLVDLAYTVNPYERIGIENFCKWVNECLPYLTNDKVSTSKTQELLDFLFFFHRRDYFSGGGTLDSCEEINVIMTELRTRLEKFRQ